MIESLLIGVGIGTFWFWAIVLISSFVIIGCVENEHYVFPSFLSLALLGIYSGTILAFGWQSVLITLVCYMLIGTVWSVFKWMRHVKTVLLKVKDKSDEDRKRLYDWKRDIDVVSNKSLLMGWVAFWPWSVAWNLTGDFFNMVYESMMGVYQGIVDKQKKKFGIE